MADEPRRYLLAVGVEAYDHWPKLNDVPKELERVVTLLTSLPYSFERILEQESEAPHAEELLTRLVEWANAPERLSADHLVIYWTGHGEQDQEKLHLILQDSGKLLTRTLLVEQLVESALPKRASGGGVLLLLDVCYSGHGGIDVGLRLGSLTRARSISNMPEIVVLSASHPREAARQSAFAEAFVKSLRQCEVDAQEHEPQLYLSKLTENLENNLQGVQTPILSGQSSKSKFFVNPKYDQKRWGEAKLGDAKPAERDPNLLSVVIIAREQGSKKLIETAKSALSRLRIDFQKHLQKFISDPPLVQILDAGEIFSDEVRLRNHLSALCRADLVIVDVTKDAQGNYEPGPMVLLGIRSVARRGVTVCSVDTKHDDLYKYDLPYNLTYLNLSSHADPHRDDPRLLSKKIRVGFDEYLRNPSYLDLPSYDAIRDLGASVESYTPVDFSAGPLYLGPLNEQFEKECFQPIEQELVATLEGIAQQRLGRNYSKENEPFVRRLLDRSATQLVAKSLCEAIRLYNFCIVDWSGLRANVFFELGIRLAAREEGAVNIIARSHPLDDKLRQVKHLSELFKPITYEHDGFESISHSVKEILERREAKWARQLNARIYREVAEAVGPQGYPAIVKLRQDLSARAKLAYLDDQDTRRTTVLHADRNLDVQHAAIITSIGLTLCESILRYGLDSNDIERARSDLEYAVEREAKRARDLAEYTSNAGDIESLSRICALLKAALDS